MQASSSEKFVKLRINRPQTGQNLNQIQRLKALQRQRMSKKRLKIPDFDLMQNLVIESHRLHPGKSEDKTKTLVANESQTHDLSSSSRKLTQRVRDESPYGPQP